MRQESGFGETRACIASTSECVSRCAQNDSALHSSISFTSLSSSTSPSLCAFLIDTLAIRITLNLFDCTVGAPSNRHSSGTIEAHEIDRLLVAVGPPQLQRRRALTPFRGCCYGFNRMLRQSRKYLVLLLAAVVVAFFVYKFRNSVALQGFRWTMVRDSLRDARLSLLALSIVAIFICYVLRALRWMRFSRTLGKTNFWNVFSATLMGFTATFILGRAGEPVRPVLIAKKDAVSVPAMFGVYVLERVFDMAATVIIAGYSLLAFERSGLIGDEDSPVMKVARSAGALLLVGVIGLAAFLIYFRHHGGEWLGRKLQHEKWRTGWL